jgi:hypothetical protein
MSANETHGNESIEPRTERALTECMTVLPDGGDVFTVVGEHGGTYAVDRREGRCTCPDHQHRRARCKHLRRVAFATAARPVPAGVDVDPHLAEHTDASPQVVATDGGSDGGIIVAGDDGEVLDDSDDSDDVDGCACDELPEGVPCWPCYRDGATFDD